MNLTLVATGGTIGSATGVDGVRRLAERARHERFSRTVSPFLILSENMTFERLETLCVCVRDEADRCDGIVVTHGTDTLAFTAAALAFTLRDVAVPVVLVSAAAPAGEPGSNAEDNMEAALKFLEVGMPGVYAAYRNPGETAQILFGARMLDARPFDGNFYAPLGRVCARAGETVEIVERYPDPAPPLAPAFGRVVTLPYHTGVRYDDYLGMHPDAFLVAGSHSGTANAAALNQFAAQASAPVYLTGGTRGVSYQSVAELHNVSLLENVAFPAAYIKLSLLYANDAAHAAARIKEQLVNEIF